MLAKSYRLVIDNQSGSALSDAVATITPWKFSATGALEYQTQQSQTWTGGVVDATQDPADSPIDNTTTLALGGHGRATLTGTGSGDVYVYLQQSDDGVGAWADVYSNPIASATLGGSAKIVEFEI